jgi:hypothetical protein
MDDSKTHMKKSSSPLRLHWPALCVAVAFVALALLALFLPEQSSLRKAARTAWTVVPIAIAITQYMYARVERFRFALNRLYFRIINPESTWGISAEFEVDDPASSWAHVEQWVDQTIKKRDRVLSRTSDTIVWVAKGTTFRIAKDLTLDDIDSPEVILRVDLPPVTRAYRSWERAIQDQAVPLIGKLEDLVRPREKKFVSKVTYPGDNPYFGLFLSQVSKSAVARVDIEYFQQSPDGRDTIRIRNDRVEMITSTLLAAQRLSLRYLTLVASPPRT